MREEKKQEEAPKVFADKQGTLGSNVNQAPSVDIDENKVAAEATEKLEEDQEAAKTDEVKKEDSTGEAG